MRREPDRIGFDFKTAESETGPETARVLEAVVNRLEEGLDAQGRARKNFGISTGRVLDFTVGVPYLKDVLSVSPTVTQNDYSPVGLERASMLVFTGGSAINITGLQAPPRSERVLFVLVTGSATHTLVDASGSSTAANRFSLGSDLAIASGRGAILVYYNSRWRVPHGS